MRLPFHWDHPPLENHSWASCLQTPIQVKQARCALHMPEAPPSNAQAAVLLFCSTYPSTGPGHSHSSLLQTHFCPAVPSRYDGSQPHPWAPLAKPRPWALPWSAGHGVRLWQPFFRPQIRKPGPTLPVELLPGGFKECGSPWVPGAGARHEFSNRGGGFPSKREALPVSPTPLIPFSACPCSSTRLPFHWDWPAWEAADGTATGSTAKLSPWPVRPPWKQ